MQHDLLQCGRDQGAKWLQNSLVGWEKEWSEQFPGGALLGIRHAKHKSHRVPRTWHKFLPEATCSTPCLLFILIFRANRGRPHTCRSLCAKALRSLIDEYIGSADLSFCIDVDVEAHVHLGPNCAGGFARPAQRAAEPSLQWVILRRRGKVCPVSVEGRWGDGFPCGDFEGPSGMRGPSFA